MVVQRGFFRAGVELIEVDPVHTSVNGAVNHACRHGIGSYQVTVFCACARREWGLSKGLSVAETVVATRMAVMSPSP
ncbi:hypothetical protein MPNT_520001 [Candidatus Methylacidithermus pantelleriae]|uniref:Uncharacterized protein n=1 Tax=Candidatus Methylacidithermus pantelleriae TaxID=2744239 RepID=A0A8J2BVT6_9BACT|nr:hypothetical protein MPNT_520001 [Candidatus Methylacidithermus pantelleriae]